MSPSRVLPSTLKLACSLDAAEAESLLDMLRGSLNRSSAVTIDANAVQVLTLPCIQILLSALKTYDNVSVVNASPDFANTMTSLGIVWERDTTTATADEINMDFGPDVTVPPAEVQVADGAPANIAESAPLAPIADAANPADAVTPDTERAIRILTIDDSKTIRNMLLLTLSGAGFDVVQAVDGEDGIAKLKNEKVDLVITDINMPKMDGYQVIRSMREDSSYDAIPILVLSTEGAQENKDVARNAGASGWMVKPFKPDVLVDTVRKVFA